MFLSNQRLPGTQLLHYHYPITVAINRLLPLPLASPRPSYVPELSPDFTLEPYTTLSLSLFPLVTKITPGHKLRFSRSNSFLVFLSSRASSLATYNLRLATCENDKLAVRARKVNLPKLPVHTQTVRATTRQTWRENRAARVVAEFSDQAPLLIQRCRDWLRCCIFVHEHARSPIDEACARAPRMFIAYRGTRCEHQR